MEKLPPEILSSFKKALTHLTGHKRRIYSAELAKAHFDGSATKVERYLGVSRQLVSLGLKELETGIQCLENYHLRGKKN